MILSKWVMLIGFETWRLNFVNAIIKESIARRAPVEPFPSKALIAMMMGCSPGEVFLEFHKQDSTHAPSPSLTLCAGGGGRTGVAVGEYVALTSSNLKTLEFI